MRQCCCCNVQTGSIILGTLNLVVSILVLIPLSAYLADSDIPQLNPIKENAKYIENILEDSLREHNWTDKSYEDIMATFREYWPTAALILASIAAVSATASMMLILGVRCRIRCLMIPFLVLTMLDIISSGAGGIIVVVALFYSSLVPGIVSAVVYTVLAVLSLYFWAVVLAAYKMIGAEEYMYSPAPTKPVPEYYPSSPQTFDMGDYGREQHYHRNQYHSTGPANY